MGDSNSSVYLPTMGLIGNVRTTVSFFLSNEQKYLKPYFVKKQSLATFILKSFGAEQATVSCSTQKQLEDECRYIFFLKEIIDFIILAIYDSMYPKFEGNCTTHITLLRMLHIVQATQYFVVKSLFVTQQSRVILIIYCLITAEYAIH